MALRNESGKLSADSLRQIIVNVVNGIDVFIFRYDSIPFLPVTGVGRECDLALFRSGDSRDNQQLARPSARILL
jgi:hypothetical protein